MPLIVLSNLILAAVFFGIWIWAKSNPLPATLTALILYITVILVNAAIDPTTIVQGIVVKVIVIVFLVRAVTSTRKFERLQRAAL